jgi:predicted GIY-YIG superfamily endonuclease
MNREKFIKQLRREYQEALLERIPDDMRALLEKLK